MYMYMLYVCICMNEQAYEMKLEQIAKIQRISDEVRRLAAGHRPQKRRTGRCPGGLCSVGGI